MPSDWTNILNLKSKPVTLPISQLEKLKLGRLNNLLQATYLRSTDTLERTVEKADGLVGLKKHQA